MEDKDNDTMMGLGSVKVDKSDMINKLKANRKKHKEDYDEAKAEYKVCYMEKLVEVKTELKSTVKKLEVLIKVEDLKQESLPFLRFNLGLSVLSNHLECYDSTLDMVEASVHEFIILSADEFNKFYRDNWDWKSGFDNTIHHYKSSAHSRSMSSVRRI